MDNNTEDLNKVYIGDVGLAIILNLAPDGEDLDITGAQNTKMFVKRPDGTTTEWAAEVHTISGETKYLRYFTQAGDLSQKGRWRVQAGLTLSGWTGRGETGIFRVYDIFK
jgi:hypothetical protein